MNIKNLFPEPFKKILRPLYRKILQIPEEIPVNPQWLTVKKKLKESKRIIDLGCGSNPVDKACAGVDLYLDPKERHFGKGSAIDLNKMKERGIRFVNSRVDAKLPFADKEFDFAYSHHVFEHIDCPATACSEMTRIAKSGAIITPSIFADLVFGRPYHKWLLMERGNKLLFFKKRSFEDRPFGESRMNPFEMLLNEGDWYQGQEGNMPRLSKLLRQHWRSHSPLMEVVFLWEGSFTWEVYD